jgi:hypothetical protein
LAISFFQKTVIFLQKNTSIFSKISPKKRKEKEKKTALVLVPQKWLAACIVEYNTSYAIFCLLF